MIGIKYIIGTCRGMWARACMCVRARLLVPPLHILARARAHHHVVVELAGARVGDEERPPRRGVAPLHVAHAHAERGSPRLAVDDAGLAAAPHALVGDVEERVARRRPPGREYVERHVASREPSDVAGE